MKISKRLILTPKEFQTLLNAKDLVDAMINEIPENETLIEDITREDLEVMYQIFETISERCKLDTKRGENA